MFHTGFIKIAASMKANITPEEYYSLKAEKDPYSGAIFGALAGAAGAGIKKKTHKAALVGAGLGGASGASLGYLYGKGKKAVKLALLKKEIESLKLKSSPGRGDYHHSSKED